MGRGWDSTGFSESQPWVALAGLTVAPCCCCHFTFPEPTEHAAGCSSLSPGLNTGSAAAKAGCLGFYHFINPNRCLVNRYLLYSNY